MEDKRLKQRLIGAVVLVSLAVIFIPMMLKGPDNLDAPIFTTNIPSQPEQRKTEIIPIKPLPPRPSNVPITAIPVEVDNKSPAAAPEPEVKEPTVAATPPRPAEAPASSKAKSDSKPEQDLSGWAVQVGSFSNRKNALGLQQRLRGKGYNAFVEAYQAKNGTRYRVRVGPELSVEKANKVAAQLKREMGIDGLVLRHK